MQSRQDIASDAELTKHHRIHLDTQIQSFKRALPFPDTYYLQKLLREEPRLNHVTDEVLWEAVSNDQMGLVLRLLKVGTNPNARKISEEHRSTILHELVKKGDEMYDLLAMLAMRRGADVCARDEDGLTPLDHAIRKKSSINVIRELMNRALRANSLPNVFLLVEAADHPESTELVDSLVHWFVDEKTKGRRVDDVLRYCFSDIFHASQVLPVVKILLDMKLRDRGEVIRRDRPVRSFVLQAMIENKVELAQLLLEHLYHTIRLLSDCSNDVTSPVSAMHETIIKHLTLAIIKGKMINDSDLKTIRSHPGIHMYHTQCINELKKMKAMKIKFGEVKRKSEFPIYQQEMDSALQSAGIRKNSLSEKEKAISQSLENILPFIPLEKIIYYFYLNEIK